MPERDLAELSATAGHSQVLFVMAAEQGGICLDLANVHM
jgi:hypothetical protein